MITQSANSIMDQSGPQLRQNESPVVVAIQGPLDGRRWEIQDELIIGRGEDCQIQIDDRQVSRHHARIRAVDGKIILEDLASKNGTFLAGKLIDDSGSANRCLVISNSHYL